ncbi:MAG: hypothetical protein ACYTEO_19955 [Planctomycetota bacterium]|jgi:hypothetical protein
MTKYKAVIKQPDGATRTKFFETEHAAHAWLNTAGRFIPQGSFTDVTKVK